MATRRQQVSISFAPDTLRYLDALAKIQHSNRSKCVTDLVWAAVAKEGVLDCEDEERQPAKS